MVVKSYGLLVSQNDTITAPSGTFLHKIIVHTATASAVVTAYNGTAITDPVIATVDGNVVGTHHYDGVRLRRGLFVKLTGAAGKVTVVYS